MSCKLLLINIFYYTDSCLGGGGGRSICEKNKGGIILRGIILSLKKLKTWSFPTSWITQAVVNPVKFS